MNIFRLFKSFHDAWEGIVFVFKEEQNFRIQLIVTPIVIGTMWFFGLRRSEVIVILLLIVLVIILELLNSAMEKFVDVIKPRLSHQIRVIKDIMAAVVLVASVGAFIIGVFIFWPYFFELFNT